MDDLFNMFLLSVIDWWEDACYDNVSYSWQEYKKEFIK